MQTPEITVTPSYYDGFTVYEICAESRHALMETVVRLAGALGRVEEFRPPLERAGCAQVEVANGPAANPTIH